MKKLTLVIAVAIALTSCKGIDEYVNDFEIPEQKPETTCDVILDFDRQCTHLVYINTIDQFSYTYMCSNDDETLRYVDITWNDGRHLP